MSIDVGEQLLKLCSHAQKEVLLVAPFIKYSALSRLFSVTAPDVKIICVTRWRPEELVQGVSDIQIWDLINTRKNASLLLRGDLHAKYYRADTECLIGSANITSTALGWSPYPNLELLINFNATIDPLMEFEKLLLSGCIQVSDDIYQFALNAMEAIRDASRSSQLMLSTTFTESVGEPLAHIYYKDKWLPLLRNPESLYAAYIGNVEQLSRAAHDSAQLDLSVLNVPDNLAFELFRRWVGIQLLQMPVVAQIDNFIGTSRRFGEVRQYVKGLNLETSQIDFDASRTWQTLMRWLLYFLPERYELIVPHHSEVIRRKT